MTQTHKWNMADTITATRMAATVFLLFLPLNSVSFFAAYTLTGLTDVLDGWIARKTGKTRQFGARLDSAADLMFYAVLLLRLFPPVWQTLPVSIWYMVTVILMVRLTSYAVAAILCGGLRSDRNCSGCLRFHSLHRGFRLPAGSQHEHQSHRNHSDN